MENITTLFQEQLKNCPAGQELNGGAFSDALYGYFVRPNEELFRQNYQAACGHWGTVTYETCALDFIPVSENEYLVLDKEAGKFRGTFSAKPWAENEHMEKSFSSVLIEGYMDMEKIMAVIGQKRWMNVYIVCGQAAPWVASYFKLGEFPGTVPSYVRFFETDEDLRQYFLENPSAYLPRQFFTQEPQKYQKMVKELHDIRVRSGVPSNNVFLSICIPTYNRGRFALKAVKTALKTEYDAEIELLVCDNGSTVDVGGYKEICGMCDSRLRYHRSEENGGYAYNIMNCLKRASGHYTVFFSDEDFVIVPNLGRALDWLAKQPPQMGVCAFSGETEEYEATFKETMFEPGKDAVLRVFNMNYVTGCCLNLDCIKLSGLFEKIERFEDNIFVRNYTHCAVGALLACQFFVKESPVFLWGYGEECAVTHDWGVKNGVIKTLLPEYRSKQQNDAVRLLADYLPENDLKLVFFNRITAFFLLVSYAYKFWGKTLKEMYQWTDIWMNHYKNCLRTLKELEGKMEGGSSTIAEIDKIFFYWLVCKREQRFHEPEENLLSSLQAQVAKYYYDKGIPIEEIDFEQIAKDLEDWVQDFLSKRS